MKTKLLSLIYLCAFCLNAQVSKTNNTSEFGMQSGTSIQRSFNFTAADFATQVGTNISDVTIALEFDVTDLSMLGFAEHENIAFQLVSPNNTSVDLIYDTDGAFSGPNPGATYSAGADAIGVVVTLDDTANTQPSFEPVTGTFKPMEALSGFDGETALGTWTLNIALSGVSFDTEMTFQSATINIVPAACVVNIPDANLKAELTSSFNGIDTNGNGEIECSEATAFGGSLFLGSLNISDATGLEAFTNIIELQIQGNNLTQLNVSTNSKLQTLVCNSNLLTNLVLGNNSDLIRIEAGNNDFSSVTVNGLPSLDYLDLSFNSNLSALNVSSNTNIKELFLEQTDLAAITLSALSNLERLDISDSKLTALDVSGNGNLLSLDCRNNSLTTLNLQNGNNANMGTIFNLPLQATGNLSLSCIQIDTGFTPGSDWQKDASATFSSNCSSLNVSDFLVNKFKIYPNPALDFINITSNKEIKSIEIFDISGKQILKSNMLKINVSNLKKGIYILKAKTEFGSLIKRFLKQ